MLNIGVFGDSSRTGTVRASINAQIGRARIYGYCNELPLPDERLKDKNYVHYPTFEEMLSDDNIDAIAISNCFCDHARYAIRALQAGKHVLSEITAAVTPKQCVELCEAAEKSNKVYALFENYALLPQVMTMKEEINRGYMGDIVFAEGEYCHPLDTLELNTLLRHREEDHWRLYRPCTFYCEHALGPLMYLLGVMPTTVFAKGAKTSEEYMQKHRYKYQEAAGVMLVGTDFNTLLQVKGCTHYAGRGRYYRVNGEYGGVEVPRGKGYDIRRFYCIEQVTDIAAEEGIHLPQNEFLEKVQYPQEIQDYFELNKVPHQGSDMLMAKNFIDAIEGISEPLFDVYKACAMSAVAIYGWRSILEGREFSIPNFKNKIERNSIREDDLNPFSINGSIPTLPCTKI